uniref:glutathione transferase n=1 Tax=Caenorhabditis tropicalis TaxID=1561998 RepID=A0A1I7TXW4_9PELO
MAVPQLYYFTIRGWGEYIRLLLTDNKVQFEDIRYVYGGKEWEEVKRTMILGQLPCLKIDGKELVQTGTIMRHLGRKHNLNGSSEEEATFLDMIFEGVRDVRMKYVRFIYFDEGTREEIVNKTLPECLEKLEKLFQTHSGDFIIGNKISYADYALFEELDVYYHLDAHILDKFPGLKGLWERMWERPNLKAYLEKRKADGVWISAVEKGMK